tara:strand:- start:670 stop:1224 length:555 start_codon:yes stop_codon:yes gene_type:complete
MSTFRENINKLIKNFETIDKINILLENAFLYIKMADVFSDYKHYPLFFEFSQNRWMLNMAAFGCIMLIVMIDSGYQFTLFKPLLFFTMTISPSLGLNYDVIEVVVKMASFILPTQIKYRKINRILWYNITHLQITKKIIEYVYFISHYVISCVLLNSILNVDSQLSKILYIISINMLPVLNKCT